MNLRILKKLSKRAAPLLVELLKGGGFDIYPSRRWEGYTTSTGHERKHFERMSCCAPSQRDIERTERLDNYFLPRHQQRWVYIRQPNTPLKGTMHVGRAVGYECPEWEEDDAWTALCEHVRGHYMEWVETGKEDPEFGFPEMDLIVHRRLKTVSAVFRAVPDVLDDQREAEAKRKRDREEFDARMQAQRAQA